jgi:hypothetical protein
MPRAAHPDGHVLVRRRHVLYPVGTERGIRNGKKDDPFCFPDMIDHKSGALKLIGIMLMVFLEWDVPPQSDHSPSAAFYGSMNANDRLMII